MDKSEKSFYREMRAQIRAGRPDGAIAKLQERLARQPADEVAASLLGSALLRAGRNDEALAVLRAACERHAQSAAAWGDLGYAQARSGGRDAALDAFRRAVELDPAFYAGWCYLSRLQFESGDVAAARASFAAADACDPLLAEFRDVQAMMAAERYAEAERRCRDLLQRQPGYPRAAYTLAHLASKVGAFEEAGRILGQALRYYPGDVNLRAARVVSQEEAGLYASALDEARHITALDPDVVASWLIRGRVHGHCGHYDDCLDCYERALALAGDDRDTVANVQLLRGHILKILGRHDDGIAAYRASIALQAGNGAGWWGLADMKTLRFDDADIDAMSRLARDAGIKQEQRTQAAFALGKACEDRADYAAAFDWYAQANAWRGGAGFDPAAHQKGVQEIRRAYDAHGLAVQAAPRPAGPRPIFIVGLPRSGSTLIEQILASHSRIEGTMELATLPNLVRRITIDGGRRNVEYPSSMSCFDAAELAAYGQAYLDETAMYRTDRPYFIDKLPTNFDKVGLIHKILPDAVIIDARRHPLDCGFSCFKQHFAGGHPWSYDLAHIGSYYRSYLELMDHWERVLPGKVLCMHYERVVADTEAAVAALLAHCGVDWEDACLRFFENRRPVRTASSEQVRQPIYTRGVSHWMHFERQLEPLKAALGEETLARCDAAG